MGMLQYHTEQVRAQAYVFGFWSTVFIFAFAIFGATGHWLGGGAIAAGAGL